MVQVEPCMLLAALALSPWSRVGMIQLDSCPLPGQLGTARAAVALGDPAPVLPEIRGNHIAPMQQITTFFAVHLIEARRTISVELPRLRYLGLRSP